MEANVKPPAGVMDGVHPALVGHFLHGAHVLPRIEQRGNREQRNGQSRHAAKQEKYRDGVDRFHYQQPDCVRRVNFRQVF